MAGGSNELYFPYLEEKEENNVACYSKIFFQEKSLVHISGLECWQLCLQLALEERIVCFEIHRVKIYGLVQLFYIRGRSGTFI